MNKSATRKPKNNNKKIQHADNIQYYVPTYSLPCL